MSCESSFITGPAMRRAAWGRMKVRSGSDGQVRGQKEWEDLKARVFSRGQTKDSNDVLSLQGPKAKKSGFGIGMGLDYEDMRDPSVMK